MFNAISWGQFTGAVFVLLLLYYTYVGLVYYQVELRGLFKSKNSVAGPTPTPATAASSLISRKPLVAKPAIAPPTTPSDTPSSALPSAEVTEAEQKEAPAKQETAATEKVATQSEHLAAKYPATEELPALDLTIDNDNLGNVKLFNLFDYNVEIITNFTELNDGDSFQSTGGEQAPALEAFDPGFTIGIAQLGNYLERAAEGQLTQEELVEQEPGLADTDLLVAFFQSSTKSAQRATSQLYADVAEPSFS